MDISSMYELRERLKASMIAGTNLIAEDFRLKRAVEAFLPLETSAPVFQKIGALCRQLLAQDCEKRGAVLLDTISLLDQVICTQGAVSVSGTLEPVQTKNAGEIVTNAPYSVLKPLLEALLSSGSGHYSYVMETRRDYPELFRDYRVKSALVSALGASYMELADRAEEWLMEETAEILPLLYRGFDPKGKREMVRRVHVISAIAGADANEFYLKMLPDSVKEVRQALIFALRYEQKNAPYIQELVIKERGNAKKTAQHVFARMEVPEAEDFFRKSYEKNPADTMSRLYLSECVWASEFVAKRLNDQFAFWESEHAADAEVEEIEARLNLMAASMNALLGKWGREAAQAFERFNAQVPVLRHYSKKINKKEKFNDMVLPVMLLEAILIHPDEALFETAKTLYAGDGNKSNPLYFPAAAAAYLLSEEGSADWLSEQLFTKTVVSVKKQERNLKELPTLLKNLCYIRGKGYCICVREHNPVDSQQEVFIYPVKRDIRNSFTDVLMQLENYDTDRYMYTLINEEDEELCERLGAYFYKRALEEPDNRTYFEPMRRCRVKTCKGLMEQYLRHQRKASQWELKYRSEHYFSLWEIKYRFQELPGNGEEKAAEAMRVLELINKKVLKVNNWDEDEYMNMVAQLRMEG